MTANSARNLLLARVFTRLKILGSVAAILLALAGSVYFFAPQWIVDGAIAWQVRRDGLQRHYLQVGDTRWVYVEGGKADGPPLVLLHGFGGTYANWLPTARYLGGNFRVIIPDLSGWGDSTRTPAGELGYAAQVTRLHAFLSQLGVSKVAIAGHSMGGAIAGLYAASYPQEVAALVLVDSAGVPFQANAFTRALQAGDNPFDIDDRADLERLAKLVFAHPPWLPPRIEDVFVNRYQERRAFADQVMHAISDPAQRNALAARLPEISAPTLAIWCRHDPLIDVSALAAIRKGLTHAPSIGVTELNGCAHMPIIERPREVAQAISRFVLVP